MARDKQNPYEPVDASPVKSFFVYMLTRDIRLEDAILDLLDNCVDGILRSGTGKAAKDKKTGRISVLTKLLSKYLTTVVGFLGAYTSTPSQWAAKPTLNVLRTRPEQSARMASE